MPPTGFPLTLLPGAGIQRRLTLANVGARRRPPARPGASAAAARPAAPVRGGRRRRLRQRARSGLAAVAPAGPDRGGRAEPRARVRPTGCWHASPRRRRSASRAPTCPAPSSPATRSARRSPRSTRPAIARRPSGASASTRRPAPGPRVRRLARRAADQRGGGRRAPRAWRDRADLALHHVVGRRDWEAISAMPRPRTRSPRASAGALRGRHAGRARRRRPGGVPLRVEHVLRAGRRRPAGRPRALALRHRRPADRQRPPPRRRRAPPCSCPTPSSTAPAWSPRSTPSSPTRTPRPHGRPRPRRWARPDAADAIAALADRARPWLTTRPRPELRRAASTSPTSAAPGMSAIATAAGRDGPPRSAATTRPATRPFLAALRARSGVAVATGDARTRCPTRRRGGRLHRHSRRPPDVVAAPRPPASRCCTASAALAAIGASRTTVAVAGTHGKTTTSALLATLLTAAGVEPGYIVGAEVAGLGRSAAWGGAGSARRRGRRERRHLPRPRRRARPSSPTSSPTTSSTGAASASCGPPSSASSRRCAGPAVLCADDPGAAGPRRARRADPVTYGTASGADYRIDDVATEGTGVRFTLGTTATVVAGRGAGRAGHPQRPQRRRRPSPLAHRSASPLDDAAAALAGFRGVARRFEVRGEAGRRACSSTATTTCPTEVAAALAAARAGPWDRVVCCFQPHRYSRTEALWRDFADAFVDADLLAVTDIYPAGEAPRPGVTGKLVVDAVLDAHPWARWRGCPTLDDVVGYLGARAAPRRPLPHPRRRRPDHGARPRVLAAARKAADRERRRRSSRRRRPPLGELGRARTCRSARSPPTASVGRPRCSSRIDDDDRPARRRRRRGRPPASTCWSWARARNLLVADAGFPGLAVVLGDALRRGRRRRHERARRAARPRCRSSPAAPWPPGSPASSGRSACPARSAARCG